MSWSLLLLKQDITWLQRLGNKFPDKGDYLSWSNLIKYHSLTQDREGNKNIPLEK